MKPRAVHPLRTCRETIALLTEYMEGDLPPPIRRALERHLELCAPCAGYLASLRTVRAAAAGLRRTAMPAEMHRRLHAVLGLRRQVPRPARRRR